MQRENKEDSWCGVLLFLLYSFVGEEDSWCGSRVIFQQEVGVVKINGRVGVWGGVQIKRKAS